VGGIDAQRRSSVCVSQYEQTVVPVVQCYLAIVLFCCSGSFVLDV